MAEYGKKKNDELAALCKERGLPHTGKKADLVKRLEDYDAKSTADTAPAAEASKPAAAEDEIDWDDEPALETAKTATTEPAAAAVAAGGLGQVANPQAVPNQQVAEDPAKTDDLTVAAAPGVEGEEASKEPVVEAATEARKTPEDFTLGLAERTLDEEIAKRKKRAEKFGLDPAQDETLKLLERAKRFGTTDVPGLLNKALPERAEREKKRGREGAEKDGGIRKKNQSRPAHGSRQEGVAGAKKEAGGAAKGGNGAPKWMNDKDREAAERRKAKYAAT